MNGIVLGMVMMLCSADEARPRLKLPRDLVTDQSRLAWQFESPRKAEAPAAKGSSKTARIVGAAIGALGGFWAGGMIGYYVAQERTDDDGVSGLRGVVIGAPIGAAAGAVLGYQLAK